MSLALKDLKVLEFCWGGVGPTISHTLAANGAQAIKVESNNAVDTVRRMSPFRDGKVGVNRSGTFNGTINTGKLGITLNLKHAKGLEIARKLICWSDIMVESFSPGVMNKLGLGYEQASQLKPELIMISLSMQGQTGPFSTHPGYGYVLQALSGFSHLTGWPDGEPVGPGMAYPDFIAGYFGLVAVLAALEQRRVTGKGQYIDLSELEASVFAIGPEILDCIANGRVSGRDGNRSRFAAPHGAYRCRGVDRWCAVAVRSEEDWHHFCELVGKPALADEPRFNSLAERKSHEDELDKLVESWTANYTPEDVMAMMQAKGIAAGVVKNAADLMADPQLEHRRFFTSVNHPEIGTHRATGQSYLMSATPYEISRPAPRLGQDNDFVYSTVLGMSQAEIDQCYVDGVFE